LTGRLFDVGWAGAAVAMACGLAAGVAAGLDPLLALGAASGLAFAVLMTVNLVLGLAAFTFLAFVAAVPNLGAPALSVVKVAGVVLAVSWLAALAGRGAVRPRLANLGPGVSFAVVAFVAWAALSAIWAEFGSEALSAAVRLGLNGILFIVVATSVRTPRHVVVIAVAFVVGATISALYGLLLSEPDPNRLRRLSGAIDNPNELATLLVSALVFSVVLLVNIRRSRPLARAGLWTALVFCLAAVMLTGSRGGLVALAVALLAAMFIGSGLRGRVAVIGLAALLVGATYFTTLATPEVREHISSVGSGSGRLDLWNVGWRMVQDEPLRGVGAGNFQESTIHYLLEPGAIQEDEHIVGTPRVAHNTYLEIVAELGIVGLVLFGGLVAGCLLAAARAAVEFARRGERTGEILSRGVTIALIATLVADLFGSRQFEKELWILLGLGPALWGMTRATRRAQAAAERVAG
jgi:hypothetical protein